MSMLFVTGGGKNKNKRKNNHFYFYFVLPKVRVGSPVKHFIKNKRPNFDIHIKNAMDGLRWDIASQEWKVCDVENEIVILSLREERSWRIL